MPPPVSSQSWNLNKKRIHGVVQKEAGESMKKAADEVKGAHGSEITVPYDGTWQRRGFSSKNGVVNVASVNGLSSKIIDTETLTNYCLGKIMYARKIISICWCHENRGCGRGYSAGPKGCTS